MQFSFIPDEFLVSIHTPTQGVTLHRLLVLRSGCFNPHSHAGSDVHW